MYRFELLQGAAARGEAELHAAVKARRDAQLVWSEQKRALDAKLQARFQRCLHSLAENLTPAASTMV